MPTAAKETFAGDLCVPDGFLWSIEAKGGYDDLSLYSLLLGCPTIESWLAQVAHDAEQSGRKPLICWRQSWKPWMAILRRRDAWPLDSGDDRYIVMGDWCGVLLDDLLQAKNEMFFKEEG